MKGGEGNMLQGQGAILQNSFSKLGEGACASLFDRGSNVQGQVVEA